MVFKLFRIIGRRIRKYRRWFVTKFFKRPLTTDEINSGFLRKLSKLTYDGTVEIYRGGLRTFQDVMYDNDNIVYILVVKTRKRKKLVLENWFKFYGNDRKW